jgi:hypothetical protein
MAGKPERKPRADLGQWVSWIINGAGYIGLGLVVAITIRACSEGIDSSDWPAVPCRIISSTVRESSSTETGVTFDVDVRYTYVVDGREYEGDRYAVATSLLYSEARDIVAGLPVGKQTECYVDPADPTRAVLVRGGHQAVIGFWIVAAFILVGFPLAAIGAFWVWDRIRRSSRRS